MGSNMKKSIFEEQTSNALKKWHRAAKQRNKQRKGATDNSSIMSGDSTPTRGSSPIHLLHQYKLRSNAPDGDGFPLSPISNVSETELSEINGLNRATSPPAMPPPRIGRVESHNIDFSFDSSPQHT